MLDETNEGMNRVQVKILNEPGQVYFKVQLLGALKEIMKVKKKR
jgi:hypothetical protein